MPRAKRQSKAHYNEPDLIQYNPIISTGGVSTTVVFTLRETPVNQLVRQAITGNVNVPNNNKLYILIPDNLPNTNLFVVYANKSGGAWNATVNSGSYYKVVNNILFAITIYDSKGVLVGSLDYTHTAAVISFGYTYYQKGTFMFNYIDGIK